VLFLAVPNVDIIIIQMHMKMNEKLAEDSNLIEDHMPNYRYHMQTLLKNTSHGLYCGVCVFADKRIP